jgi:hypothetical protein
MLWILCCIYICVLLNAYYSTLLYKSTLVKSFQFSVLNFTVISLLTCPLSFVMICRMQRKKERKKERKKGIREHRAVNVRQTPYQHTAIHYPTTCTITALPLTCYIHIIHHLFSFYCWWCHWQTILLFWRIWEFLDFYVAGCQTCLSAQTRYRIQHICAVL